MGFFVFILRRDYEPSKTLSLAKTLAADFAGGPLDMATEPASPEINREMIRERPDFEDLLAGLLEDLGKAPLGRELDRKIARAVDLIRLFFGDDCCGLLEVLPDQRQIQTVQASCREGSAQGAKSMQMACGFPLVHSRLVEKRKPMAFSSLEELPPEGNGERAFWESLGLQALVMIPLPFRGVVTHVIGLADRGRRDEWAESCLQRLRLLGGILARALIQRRVREALLRSRQELAEALGEVKKLLISP
jgi:hypothetical protein